MKPHSVVLGLGSNLGDREAWMRAAIAQLSHQPDPVLHNIRFSSLYETAPLLPDNAPESWNKPFLNMAVAGECFLESYALLDRIKHIESQMGRTKDARWGPREIDIDILVMDDLVVQDKDLILPHPQLLTRDFALVPLAELMPNWRCTMPGPHANKSAEQLVKEQVMTVRSITVKRPFNYALSASA